MFHEINGLPAHVLVLHAAVVLVPLAALMGVLFAVPRTRSWARLPLLLVSLAAAAAVFAARQSGLAFKEFFEAQSGEGWDSSSIGKLVAEHQSRANLLLIIMLVYAAVAVVGFFLSRDLRSSSPVLGAVIVLMVIGAAGLAFQVYRVGDIGSRAVWNPDGNTDYSQSAE